MDAGSPGDILEIEGLVAGLKPLKHGAENCLADTFRPPPGAHLAACGRLRAALSLQSQSSNQPKCRRQEFIRGKTGLV
jgi:hypothetical protein